MTMESHTGVGNLLESGSNVDYMCKGSELRLSILMAVFCHNPHAPPKLFSPTGSN